MTDNAPYRIIESRPSTLIAARYDEMPFPIIRPMQELAFDLGITAFNGTIELTGIAMRGYNGHQLLFEQRWPGRVIRQHVGNADLVIPAKTGLPIRRSAFYAAWIRSSHHGGDSCRWKNSCCEPRREFS